MDTRDHRRGQRGSSFGKGISMLISRDTSSLTVDQTFQRGIGRTYEGVAKSREIADLESVIGRKVASCLEVVKPDKSCSMAWVSAVKLEAFGPAKERNREEIFHLELMAYVFVPPVQRRKE